MNQIKIAFNWIGPKGPLWNTEVPNVLGMAHVMDQVLGMNTNNYWADDIFHKIFLPARPRYDIAPAWLMEDKDVFIYPFSLGWRIPFNFYFFPNAGILEFGHTPTHIIHQVRNNNGYFLIDLGAETHIQDMHLDSLTSYFRDFHKIPMSKIIYLTGCINASEIYESYCIRKNVPNTPRDRMNILSYPASQESYATYIGDPNNLMSIEPEYNTESIPEKLFLMWNRRFRPHRNNLVIALDKVGLVDRSYVSMSNVEPELSSTTFQGSLDIHTYPNLGLTDNDAEQLIKKLPLVIDGETNVHQMCGDFDNSARKFYQNSLFSLVTETNFNMNEVSVTEKSFKPIREKHPFIIVGVVGTLRSLRSLGFQTFSEFWDESYDLEINDSLRLEKIVKLCHEISTWSNEKILDFKRRVKPILESNRRLLTVKPSARVAEQIYTIISNKHQL